MLNRIASQTRKVSGKSQFKEPRKNFGDSPVHETEGEGFSALLDSAKVESKEAIHPPSSRGETQFDLAFEKLNVCEQNLIDFPNETNFEYYKSMVRDLLSQLLGRAYRIKSIRDFRSKSEFEVIQSVDKSLSDIYLQIAQHSPNVRNVLHSMGYIKGVLLDLQV